MDVKMNRKGQIAIFVIVGILLVAAFAFIFFINRKPTITRGQDLDNPESYIDNCLKERATALLDEILPRAGFIDANDTILYKGYDVTYLCKNINYYRPCINQYPRYVLSLEREFAAQLGDDVSQCFAEIEQELTRRNYAVDGGDISLEAKFKRDIVELRVYRDFSISKDGFTRDFDLFDVYIVHPVFDLALIVNEIVAQEARWCYFSNDGFMLLYNDFDIHKDIAYDGSTKIYIVKDKITNKAINFAIRGCAIPAGF